MRSGENVKQLKYKGIVVCTAEYKEDGYVYTPVKRLLLGRDPLWFWLRRKLSELGWSYQLQTPEDIITLFPAGNETTLDEAEGCIKWTYYKALDKMYGRDCVTFY